MTEVWYVAHPVVGDVAGNVARARRWLRWLIDQEPLRAFCCPWIPYVEVLPDADAQQRERGLRDDEAMAARCDGIVLVGGRISSGMRREMLATAAAGGRVVDLTGLGAEPPPSELAVTPLSRS